MQLFLHVCYMLSRFNWEKSFDLLFANFTASIIAHIQNEMLQRDAISCPILGIQYVHIILVSGIACISGFAIAIRGKIRRLRFAMTIAAKMIAGPFLFSPQYTCPRPGIKSDNKPAIIGDFFIIH